MRRWVIAIVACLCLGASSETMAVDYYAHPTINDDSDCTCEATGSGAGPCSAQKAVDCAGAGSTVYFETGTEYDLTAAIDFDTNAGTSASFITYTTPSCDPTDSTTWAIWDGQSTAAQCWTIADNADWLIIECQEFKNATAHNVYAYGDAQHWRNIKCYSSAGFGFNAFDCLGCHVSNIEAYSNSDDNIRIRYGHLLNALAYDGSTQGIFVEDYSSITQSIADSNGAENLLVNATHNTVVNFASYNPTTAGVDFLASNCTVYNSLFENSGTYGIECDAGEQCHSDYNLLYNNSTADYLNVTGKANDITSASASQFVDAPNGDFTLAIGAAARNAGMPVLCPSCSTASTPDIGAWQAGASGGQPIFGGNVIR